ncbi:hypothetical protein [Prescottella subtropica]|uniref:hypothetical protein n=1 Tax=Prescottella subtropica TaxID=2545757 RepID=UPI001F4F63B9|nr:hypothetical protein [Prescottella subtropica]
MTPAGASGRDRRVLTVLVEELAIEDGEIPPPRVGEVLAFPLRFVEYPADDGDTVTVRGLLEPSGRPPVLQRTGDDTPRRWEWSGLLHGDGWTASWRGFRPLTGRVDGRVPWGGVNRDPRFRDRVGPGSGRATA